MMKSLEILLCGYGCIGQQLLPTFELMGNVAVYDPRSPGFYVPTNFTSNELIFNKHFDLAFVCVPAETKEDGTVDTSIVEDVCKKIRADVVVIKSTMPVGMTEKLFLINDRVIFSPEFTSATQHRGVQNFVVLGGPKILTKKVAEAYKRIMPADFEIIYTDSRTAELSKYMMNCYLAMKVTFCNEIAKACDKAGIEYDDVRNIFIKDSRINPSHTFVYEDQPYYDSHCFNKDIPAFNTQFHLPLMSEVERINNEEKDNKRKA